MSVCAVCVGACCASTRENAPTHRKRSRAVSHKRTIVIIILAAVVLLLAGCGSFWEDQGAASRTAAEARLRQAEAQRQNAQAAIIDAEARGALANSQARALTTAMDANASLTRQAVALADRGEYVWLGAGLAVLGLAIGGLGLVLAARRPVVIVPAQQASPAQQLSRPQRGIIIESEVGGRVLVEPEPGETRYYYMQRVRQIAAAIKAAEDVEL